MANRIFKNQPQRKGQPARDMHQYEARIKAIKNDNERWRAHELLDDYETAADLARGPDARRATHWGFEARERADKLEEHLKRWG